VSEIEVGPGERPVVSIVGDKVALGPLRRDLLASYRHWLNDFETIRGYEMPEPMTDEAVARWFDWAGLSERNLLFTLYERDTTKPIGHTGLIDVNRKHRHAAFDIVIGDAQSRGKGYGTEAASLVLDFAFNAVGLQSVFLEVLEFNLAGIRAYEKAGFRQVGRLRQNWFVGGKFWDMIYMDCVAEEFKSREPDT
jgi:diamine N-acetyltransferase